MPYWGKTIRASSYSEVPGENELPNPRIYSWVRQPYWESPQLNHLSVKAG